MGQNTCESNRGKRSSKETKVRLGGAGSLVTLRWGHGDNPNLLQGKLGDVTQDTLLHI